MHSPSRQDFNSIHFQFFFPKKNDILKKGKGRVTYMGVQERKKKLTPEKKRTDKYGRDGVTTMQARN